MAKKSAVLRDEKRRKMYEKYTNYFPDKVYETVGKESDYEKGIYKGQGPVFEKIVEDLKAVFGI